MKINIKNISIKSICATLFISLFLSCNNGIEELEKRNTFLSSLANLGNDFLSVFTSFGDALGFSAVKSGDTKDKVGAHFEKIKKGLEETKGKLDGLAKDIVSVPHADTKGIEAVIESAITVIAKLIDSLTKLAGVTKAGGEIIGYNTNSAATAVAATADDVKAVILGVTEIIRTAKESGVDVDSGKAGGEVATEANGATDTLSGSDGATQGAGSKFAGVVSEADPWAMIDKMKDAKATAPATLDSNTNYGAGDLATGTPNQSNGSKAATKADFAAAVALKAMIKNGKFSAVSQDVDAVKAAAATAVNKVLGVLDEIVRKTVVKKLEEVGKAVKEVKYSETIDESTGGRS
ncbi:variable large family protein [Borrelia coriaceae]|nr:variable large family protein [Borrelia coriaceae]